MKRRIEPAPATPIVFTRADPAELARFDPSSKICSANCGPHRDDPRTELERRFLCGDCHPGERAGPAAVRVTVSTPDGQPLAQWERDSAGRLVTSEPVERPQSAPPADRLLPTGNQGARQDGPKAQAGGAVSTVTIRSPSEGDLEALTHAGFDLGSGRDVSAVAVRCDWCASWIVGADAGPPCATEEEADRCDVFQNCMRAGVGL